MEPGLPHDVPGVRGAHDVGNHDARGVDFEGPHQIAVAAPGDPHHEVQPVGLGRQNITLHEAQIGGDVLLTAPGAVEPGQARDLDGAGAVEVEFHGVGVFARAQFAQDPAGDRSGFLEIAAHDFPFFLASVLSRR